MPDREPVWWSCDPESEHLSSTDIDDAVDVWTYNRFPDPLPERVKVYGYARMELPSAEEIADRLTWMMFEWLDEDYADPSADPTEASPALVSAALTFAETLRAEYPVFMCERVIEQEVLVSDYANVEDYNKAVEEHWAKHGT